MAKIKLGNRPKTFKPVSVKFIMPDGTPGNIECVFKYRTKKEFGAFIDVIFADAKAKAGGEAEDIKPAEFSMADLMDKTLDKHADYLLESVDKWDLDEELTRANLQQLSDECPAAVIAVMDAYRAAAMEGRLGN